VNGDIMADRRLYKSKNNRMISGVMGGIAEYFNVDPTIVRILYFLFSAFSAAFPGIIVYIILALVIPEKPSRSDYDSHDEWSEF
jgi:phage shock protein C